MIYLITIENIVLSKCKGFDFVLIMITLCYEKHVSFIIQ